MKSQSNYRWFVFAVFFVFMLLHQADKLLIGPLTTQIMDDFKISMGQMGAVTSGALIVGGLFYPLWGYLYDRYARSKLLALASFLWGASTWLNARARSYTTFLITRSSTGIDDSSYPGLFSLIADYFRPQVRGKIYGLLYVTAPVGYLLGMMLGLLLSPNIGWRGVFYLTGSLGILLAIVIFLGVREPKRGTSEPEMQNIEEIGVYRFNRQVALGLFRKPSLILLFIQGFFGVFPWNAITYWFFAYLERERNYTSNQVLVTMVIAVLVLAAGYPIGGAIGDFMFKRSPRGRIQTAMTGTILGAIFLAITLNLPIENQLLFITFLALTAIFMPFPTSNVISTVYDITLPEIRSTAMAVQFFIEGTGAALSPWLIGLIADRSSLKDAFLIICLSAWLLTSVVFTFTAILVPRDIAQLRGQLRERAEIELHRESA